MINLYHGSNVRIDKIELKRSRKGKDFGCGFLYFFHICKMRLKLEW